MSISYAIRKWAFQNARAAQVLIVLSTILLCFLGQLLGVLAELLGVDPYAMFLIGTGTAILAWTLAPRKGENFPIRYSYSKQKVAVVIMLTSVTVGIGGGAVWLEKPNVHSVPTVHNHNSEAAIGPGFAQKASTGKVDRILSDWFYGGLSKRVFKKFRKAFHEPEPNRKSVLGMIFATIGCLFLTWFLASLIMFLSCSLSCNGNVVLGHIVLIGGLILLVFLFVKCLSWIYRNPNKKKPKRRKPNPN